MEPAPEGGKNADRAVVGQQDPLTAAMEPAPEGGKNAPETKPLSRWQQLPQWSPPRRAGRTEVHLNSPGGEARAAMEPAPEGGKNDGADDRVRGEPGSAAMEPAPEGGKNRQAARRS